MVTWKSASTSSRNASNASSVRSSSSISSTGAPAGSGSSACSSGRLIRKRSENTSCSSRSRSCVAFGLGDADRDHLRGIVPLVDRGRDVEPLVALQPDQPAPERRRQHLGDLGLADAGLAFEEQRPAHLAARGTARSRASGRRDSPPTPAGRASRRSRRAANGAPASGSWSRLIARHRRACLAKNADVVRMSSPQMRMPGTKPGIDAMPGVTRRRRR